MREIKFRAWNPETKKMFHDFDQNIKEVPLGKSIHLFVYETGLHYKTLMQFTGLKDKNGKEIYEGDILSKVTIDELGKNIQYFYVVIWSSSDNGFKCKHYVLDENEDGIYWRLKSCLFDYIAMVNTYNHVIGNIYENPEILNQ